jgi:two-component system alkaline phosphatase synthesis response regulator PhoP
MSSPAPPARPARVLIAEDNPQGAELVEAYLAETDYDVETATDGEEALRKARANPPDVVLLDIMMPRISGFEVCKQLRADPHTAGVAILMITALDQPSDIEKAVEAGCDDFLTKPLNKTELLLRVRALLKSRRQPHEPDRLLDYIDAVQGG